MEEFNVVTRLFLKGYPWRVVEPTPWKALRKPLSECKLGLVTSAGFTAPGQPPFDPTIMGGDVSFRVIANSTPLNSLKENHRSGSFDHRGIQSDPNLAFPIDRANELVAAGKIGAVNHSHLSFMGSIVAPGKLRVRTAPEAAALFKQDQVDIALLVPV